MEKAELRSLVFSVLRSQPQTQFNGVIGRLRNLSTEYSGSDDLTVHEILWELLIQGVLAPGMNTSNMDLPFVHVTEYGEQCLEAGEFVPHDSDGYLKRLQMRAGRPLDGVILAYVEASLSTFLGGHYLAAMELLGVASERCVDLLILAYTQYLNVDSQKQSFRSAVNQVGRDLTKRISLLRGALLNLQLPREHKESTDVLLSGLFTILRHTRDPFGRPTGNPVGREVAHGNLLLFAPYCQRVYQILDYLQPVPPPKPVAPPHLEQKEQEPKEAAESVSERPVAEERVEEKDSVLVEEGNPHRGTGALLGGVPGR